LPLLLKTSYCEALERAAVTTGNEEKCQTIRANINDDPDVEDFMQRLTELLNKNAHDQRQQQLAQLSFLHQFVGNSAMANFGQIVEQQQSRMAKLNDSSTEDDQQQIEQLPSDLFLFWSKSAYRVCFVGFTVYCINKFSYRNEWN
jgi:transcription initiation factor IIF auxiliary subunit